MSNGLRKGSVDSKTYARHYPLRTANRGHGPIRCGFHHWQYDAEGRAVGIPKCDEQFGAAPRQLDRRLRHIEIDICGSLLFGRFPSGSSDPSLSAYLREAFPILQASFGKLERRQKYSTRTHANWKLGYEISLDDYHLVAVHPDTFGRGGYLKPDVVRYFRFGPHSAYFYGAEDDALVRMSADCAAGKYVPRDYRIFQIFPNLILVHFEARGTWYSLLQQYAPTAHDEAEFRFWLTRAPYYSPKPAPLVLFDRIASPLVLPIIGSYIRKIGREDNAICEGLQRAALSADFAPAFARHEQRIAWFEEAYAEAIQKYRKPDLARA